MTKQHFLRLPDTPLADKFVFDQPHYPLGLTVDPEKGWLVELEHQVPDSELFGSDYAFHSGTSPALVEHLSEYAEWVKANFSDELSGGIVEIASNDGTFLRHFADNPGHLGIDPAGPPSAKAREAGLNVMERPFTTALAADLHHDRVVVANNVIAHVPDMDDFLRGMALLIGTTGVGILEFQYLPDLLAGNQFDLVYHEHRRYLSLTSLAYALDRHGLGIGQAFRVSTQGGSMRVVVRPTFMINYNNCNSLFYGESSFVTNPDTYFGFQGRVEYLCARIYSEVAKLARTGTVALWGASAKATTLLYACGLDLDIDFASDLDPYKVGKVMPGTEIPIIHPGDHPEPDVYLVGSRNYLSRARNTGAKLFVPLPTPELIV